MNDILIIINEEVKKLFENLEVYTIPELAALMGSRMKHDANTVRIYTKMLFNAYKEGGDQAVVKMYTEIAGVEIEALRNGRYVFANLSGGGEPMLQELQDIPLPDGLSRRVDDVRHRRFDERPAERRHPAGGAVGEEQTQNKKAQQTNRLHRRGLGHSRQLRRPLH